MRQTKKKLEARLCCELRAIATIAQNKKRKTYLCAIVRLLVKEDTIYTQSNTTSPTTRDGVRAWQGARRATLRLFRPPRQAEQRKLGMRSYFRLELQLSQRRGTCSLGCDETFCSTLSEPHSGFKDKLQYSKLYFYGGS